jgi:glycosyltransferase involved in cell wall biosynthesis
VRAADAVLCATDAVLDDVHRRIGASLLRVPDGDDSGDDMSRYLEAVAARAEDGGLRVLMLGPVNSPHVEHLALALHEKGVRVQAAGEIWPGLPPSALPAAGVPLSIVNFPFVLWLRRLVREVRPDVVHAHWTPFAFKALLARARPLVATPWGSDVYRAEGRFAQANRPVARLSDMVVTDSQDLIDRMIGLGAPRERTMLLNWGVDLERFSPGDRAAARERLGLGAGPVILSPRLLKPLYNPEAIVAAFRRIRERVPDAQLVLKHMATEPPELPPLPDGVRVIGQVPYEQMPDYYRAADVCVSVPDTDSSPRSVWEAMACGCPCVLSDLPWARELIEPGADALLVQPEPGEIAAAIERVLRDPALASSLSERGRALVERHRNRDRETDRLIHLYRRLAGQPPV